MRTVIQNRGIFLGSNPKTYSLCEFQKRFLFSENKTPNPERRTYVSLYNDEKKVKLGNIKERVFSICEILRSRSWSHSLENALSITDKKSQTDLVIGVLRKLKDVNQAVNFFRWVEKRYDQVHCPEAYNSLLQLMARSENLDFVDQILHEMSVAGFGPSNLSSIELVLSCIKSGKLQEAFDFLQTMRKYRNWAIK